MSADDGERFSLKDHLFNRKSVSYLASLMEPAVPDFDKSKFVSAVMRKLLKLELKQRILHITEVMERHLAEEFPVAAKQIVAALPPPLDPTKTDDDFGDFIIAPFGEYVVRNGMSQKHLSVSLRTLKELTKRFSMEFAIRPFINQFPEVTLKQLTKWSTDKNYHVRRLVSEGTRPSLPWSGKIDLQPATTVPLLDALHSDSTRYVTRSVANHLNDLSKVDKTLVFDTLRRWQKQRVQERVELDWMLRHALRTLVKRGDAQAMELLGFRAKPKIQVSGVCLSTTELSPGETLEFSFDVTAKRSEKLIVDYAIDFVKANGATAEKVFKLKQIELEKGETMELSKKHKFRANATTFTLHPGTHRLTVQINGQRFSSAEFQLLPS